MGAEREAEAEAEADRRLWDVVLTAEEVVEIEAAAQASAKRIMAAARAARDTALAIPWPTGGGAPPLGRDGVGPGTGEGERTHGGD